MDGYVKTLILKARSVTGRDFLRKGALCREEVYQHRRWRPRGPCARRGCQSPSTVAKVVPTLVRNHRLLSKGAPRGRQGQCRDEQQGKGHYSHCGELNHDIDDYYKLHQYYRPNKGFDVSQQQPRQQ